MRTRLVPGLRNTKNHCVCQDIPPDHTLDGARSLRCALVRLLPIRLLSSYRSKKLAATWAFTNKAPNLSQSITLPNERHHRRRPKTIPEFVV
jgi:hypothetical protein